MVAPLLFFLAAITVKHDQTPVRAGCDAEAETVASLPEGTPVEIRFRLADGSDCFKIAATVGGKPVSGYVPASALAGLDGFEQERSSAASADVLGALNPVATETKKAVVHSGDPILMRATELIESNQPAQALALLEPALKRYPNNPSVLLLAGVASYRSDQLRAALDYWKQSLDLAPNEKLSRIYDRVRREAQNDRSGEKLYGLRVALRYEGATLPAESARAMLSLLDEEFVRISGQLGCTADERIVAIVQSREAYLRTTGAAEWSGGLYDGRIHIALMEGDRVGPQTRRAAAHELVHACLSNLASGSSPWPAWLQEGLAQKLSGDTLQSAVRDQLRQLAEAHRIPRLENLRQNWSRLSSENAQLAYSLALAAADVLVENYSAYGIRNVVSSPQTLQQITADLDRRLGL